MRLVHLSDIHFGGYGQSGWDEDEDQRRELVRDLERLVEDGGPVDGILVGGDIAFSAQPAEYEIADAWLEQVCRAGGCDISRVWVVPGNHDIDRAILTVSFARSDFRQAVLSCAPQSIDKALNDRLARDPAAPGLMAALTEYNEFAGRWGPCSFSAAHPHWFDDTLSVGDADVRLTGLNSVLVSDTHDGFINDRPTLVLGTWQCSLPRGNRRIHIAFCHHPPNWLRDWELVEPYLLRAHLLLFGHEHRYAARQRVADGTVEVFAGAVGPERLGEAPGEEYSPTWNLLTLELDGEIVAVTVNPRVWYRHRTRFDLHPDDIRSFRVRVDLENLDMPDTSPSGERREAPHEALPASPLLPDYLAAEPPVESVSAGERSKRRSLGVRFMRLSPTERLRVARNLEVAQGLDDPHLDPNEAGRTVLRRVRDAEKIDRLAEELENG
mgnify:CR=1 FL=1